jgi:prepilin-type N-terminal cleavage/methylation domain-containing protein
MKRRGTARQRAFTLVEVMVAVAIFGLVITAVYAAWTQVIRSTQAGTRAAADSQRERVALRTIEEALAGAILFTESAGLYSFAANTAGPFSELSFVSHLPATFWGGRFFGGQSTRRVSLAVELAPDGAANQLVLRQTLLLATAGDAAVHSTVLAGNVDQFYVEFWSAAVSQWITEWDSTNQIPKLMRVQLALGRSDGAPVPEEALKVRVVSLAADVVSKAMHAPDPPVMSRVPTKGGPGSKGGPGNPPGPGGKGGPGQEGGGKEGAFGFGAPK